jgi:zinc/manganese transport system substrate-binding protein
VAHFIIEYATLLTEVNNSGPILNSLLHHCSNEDEALQRRTYLITVVLAVILVVATSAGLYFNRPASNTNSPQVQVVAAENFWGSLVSQIGGTHTQVLSIVSDPNADPHDYEISAANARAFANANFVIVNGAGYDDWALRLLSANSNPNQKILNVANLLGKQAGDNPHFWYSPSDVNETVHAMYANLVSVDRTDATYYGQQYANLNISLGQYNSRINEIAAKFSGKLVASTESIFAYMADATQLHLISPPGFMKAVAEGNDPTTPDRILFERQIINGTQPGNATLLVYNEQTVTQLTQTIKAEAAAHLIPIVGVTETVQPSDVRFQDWMNAELIDLQNALNSQALGH